jgi:hypothetical protein
VQRVLEELGVAPAWTVPAPEASGEVLTGAGLPHTSQ